MPTLSDMNDKEHWLLHLNHVEKDTPSLSTTVRDYKLSRADLPNINFPWQLHDWLEKPGTRAELEALNG